MLKKFFALGLAVAALGAIPASAANLFILASGVSAFNQSGTAATKVLITSSSTSITFKTTKPSTPIYVNFAAECGSIGTGGWTSAVILVDGVALAPSGTSQAMCSAQSTSAYFWKSGTTQGIGAVAAGTHTVEVQASSNGGATGWWIGDASIIVGKF